MTDREEMKSCVLFQANGLEVGDCAACVRWLEIIRCIAANQRARGVSMATYIQQQQQQQPSRLAAAY